MNIKRIIWIACILALIASLSIGLKCRSSYTDITADADYIQNVRVAELPESLAMNLEDGYVASLQEANYILCVKPLEAEIIQYHTVLQKVVVERVIRADNIREGDILYLYSQSNGVHLNSYSDVDSKFGFSFKDCGFVHPMRMEESYLCFFEGYVETRKDNKLDYPILQYLGLMLKPQFSFTNHVNKAVKISKESDTTYVDYLMVQDNEFFGTTNTAIDCMEKVKEKIMAEYVS